MRHLVLDASVILKWFARDGERHLGAARALRNEYERGLLVVVAPRILPVELLAATATTTAWPSERLARVAEELNRLKFDLREPPMSELARWLGRGLTGSDAAYAAVASAGDVPLITDDEELLRLAAPVAQPLATD